MEQTPSGNKRLRAGVITALVVIVAAGTGYLVGQHRSAPSTSLTPTSAPAVTAQADSNKPAARVVPDVLPGFELQDRDGTLRKLAEWTGRPLVVNFWATWCPPCRREIPLLNKLRVDRKKQNLEIVGIAVDFREDVLAYAKKEHISYPLLIGEEDGSAAVDAVGMTPAFPFTLFADSQQRIVTLKVGELHQEELDLILDRVADIDAQRLTLAAAREQISEGLKQLATKKALADAAAPAKTAI